MSFPSPTTLNQSGQRASTRLGRLRRRLLPPIGIKGWKPSRLAADEELDGGLDADHASSPSLANGRVGTNPDSAETIHSGLQGDPPTERITPEEIQTSEHPIGVGASSATYGSARDRLGSGTVEEPEGAEAPTRLCPHCATLSRTAGDFCPQCGTRFSSSGRSGVSKRVRLVAAGLVVLLVLGGTGVAVAIKAHHDSQVAAQHRQAAAAAAAAAQRAAAAATARQQAAAAASAAQQAQQAAEVTQRQGLETQLQNAITNDATEKANQGVLFNGPAQSTTCTPISGGSSQSLSQASGTYSCIAVYQTNSDGTSSGYRYSGTINFSTGSFTWQPATP